MKYLLIAFLALIIVGCKPEEPHMGYQFTTITYERHDYVLCRDIADDWRVVAMVHSASCHKCEEQKTTEP